MKYYTLADFACKCGCGTNEVDPTFADFVDILADRVGQKLPINSGFRCAKHNAEVSHVVNPNDDPHVRGEAVDLGVDRGLAYRTLQQAVAMRAPDGSQAFTGIGLQQKGTGRYIHLDRVPNATTQPRPTIWTYP